MILALALAVIVAVFASAVAGPNDPTPPVGWFFVVLMAEIVGMALGGLA